ncbi:chorismate mutase [Lacticaseibacillus manihotivorans]|uniref:chorismate mutase n=1 Tax=Lacticaseibacillus manihotivorans TaxID=88233 RepID=UPI000B11B36D|nr:chorismate mutase [Lacticaseibacillus manihotivorans]
MAITTSQQAQAGLAQARQHINELDQQIAALLAERFETVDEIARLKKAAQVPVKNQAREAQVLDQVLMRSAQTNWHHMRARFLSRSWQNRVLIKIKKSMPQLRRKTNGLHDRRGITWPTINRDFNWRASRVTFGYRRDQPSFSCPARRLWSW